jgi:hypothetical protein
MNMVYEQLALALPAAATWTSPKGKGACGRDHAAGLGTCWHWWDGCPKAKKRGCYLLHAREHNELPESANG